MKQTLGKDRQPQHRISTLNEKALHAALKDWYAKPGDRFEQLVDRYLVDIVRGSLLVEVQTSNFSAIKRKLARLVEHHRLRLVYPVPVERHIVRLDADRRTRLGRRKSPKRGRLDEVFAELVYIPFLLGHPNFSLEVVLIHEEQERCHYPGRAWRRNGWVNQERKLLTVVGTQVFETLADYVAFIPDTTPEPFTTADLAKVLGRPRWLAQKMVYTLREAGALESVGKKGNAWLYRRATPVPKA